MADVAILADGVVHDIRNPLNVIRSNLYLLRQRLAEAEPRTIRSLDRIDDQVTAALRLLEGLQALYRSDHPQPQRVNLNELVCRVVESSPQDHVEYRLGLAPDLPLVTADPELLEAALRAVLRNAQDAVMRAESVPERTVALETSSDASAVTLSVEDRGLGIPAEHLPRIFEPFFTTRRAHAGLGLALTAKILAAQGGSVRVESRPGAGTTVRLVLSRER